MSLSSRLMKILRILPVILFISALGSVSDAAPAHLSFLAGIEDVPLMPGFKELADSLVVFDKPDGRIVLSEAEGKAVWAGVRGFYLDILPQLGWKLEAEVAAGATPSLTFTREGDRLKIEAPAVNLQRPSVKLRFSLTPD